MSKLWVTGSTEDGLGSQALLALWGGRTGNLAGLATMKPQQSSCQTLLEGASIIGRAFFLVPGGHRPALGCLGC